MGSQKGSPYQFSPVTSTNVGIRPQNSLTFSLNSFSTLVKNVKFVPSASPKLSKLNRDHPSKKQFFWSNPYKIKVVITSLIEMLQLPNFGHMNTSTMYLESCDKVLLVTSLTENMTSQPLFQNTVILRRPGVAIFVDIIKISTRFIKKIFKDSRKAKRVRIYELKCNLYLYFLI